MRLRDLLLAGLILLGLAFLTQMLDRAERASGTARAVDGDSLALGDTRVRLAGIDAPELSQTCGAADGLWACGRAAQDHLADLVRGRAVECTGEGHDAYARLIAACTVVQPAGAPLDLAGALVEAGLAVARDRSGYGAREADARRAGRGIWSGPFARPEDWRAAHPR